MDASFYQDLPTLEDRACMIAAQTGRIALPAFVKRINAGTASLAGIHDGLVARNLAIWDALQAAEPGVLSHFLMNALPPYADEAGVDLAFPLADRWLQQKFNVSSVIIAREHALGHAVNFTNMYPPTTDYPRFATAAELRAFFTDVYIPEKVKEATFAEQMKAEIYNPHMVEWEVIMNGQTTLFCDGPAPCLSKPQQIALAQELLSAVAAAVRPHFTGILQAGSYQTYALRGTEWNQLDFSGYDQVSFTINPKCAVSEVVTPIAAQLDAYLASQLANYAVVMSHAPAASFTFGEVFATPAGFGICGVADRAGFEAIEDAIYQQALSAIDALQPADWGGRALAGIGFDADLTLTDAARARQHAWLAAH
jgi:hypothetical protein